MILRVIANVELNSLMLSMCLFIVHHLYLLLPSLCSASLLYVPRRGHIATEYSNSKSGNSSCFCEHGTRNTSSSSSFHGYKHTLELTLTNTKSKHYHGDFRNDVLRLTLQRACLCIGAILDVKMPQQPNVGNERCVAIAGNCWM